MYIGIMVKLRVDIMIFKHAILFICLVVIIRWGLHLRIFVCPLNEIYA